jgi:23S rRNA (adenine2030-N6)-methyltransferase
MDGPPAALADYVSLVRDLGLYPGSPAIARALLRPDDRLTCCELQPEDAATLRRQFARDPQVAIHHRDGYEAVGALLPPPQRRGLVFIDPPFEQPDEFSRLADALVRARARFPAGVLAAWYPIKHRAPVRAFLDAMRAGPVRDVVAAELLLREPLDAARLNGCGLLLAAPPFRFEEEAPAILAALSDRLGGIGGGVTRVVDE